MHRNLLTYDYVIENDDHVNIGKWIVFITFIMLL